jgi:hypothetical protein
MERYRLSLSRDTLSRIISIWFGRFAVWDEHLLMIRQIHFSRANALAAYKAQTIEDISRVSLLERL